MRKTKIKVKGKRFASRAAMLGETHPDLVVVDKSRRYSR